MGSSALFIPKAANPIFYPNYGLLYNLYAIFGAGGTPITSIGFHIPTVSEWLAMAAFLGGQLVAGTKLREGGFIYWNNLTGTIEGTNDVGFNGRGAGVRSYSTGAFSALNGSTRWAVGGSNDDFDTSRNSNILSQATGISNNFGISVRPMKDSTSLSHGQSGIYTDPSGITYRTICINTQEWVADNIKTQHYRDGSPIAEVTDNAAWVALSAGALCAYNNDWANV